MKGLEIIRPWELEPFDGSIEEVAYMVDHSSWKLPKRVLSIPQGYSGIHVENGRMTGLTSRSINVEFDTPFPNVPTGDVKVYRMVQVSAGMWRKEDVLWGFISSDQPSPSGFQLNISSTENLTGIICEYLYL